LGSNPYSDGIRLGGSLRYPNGVVSKIFNKSIFVCYNLFSQFTDVSRTRLAWASTWLLPYTAYCRK